MRAPILGGLLVLTVSLALHAADDYVPGPDSKSQPGVPQGEVTKYSFDQSKIFPGTTRDYWVYVPKQYDAAKPACVMVFQDGLQYNAPVVFDNLIARKEIPVIIGVFIMPGIVKARETNSLDRFNRSYEYDGLGDNYARFLLEELLPEVAKKYNLSTNGNDRAIAGNSSGAIAAFTAAWERPEAFRRVFSGIGTYVGLRGGNVYPTLIRKTEPKPLRVFLQDGANDQNIYGGNWFLANQEMLSALEFAGYEVNYAWGEGPHSSKHATAIFPDALRWLWRDYPAPIDAGLGSKQPVMDVLIPGEDWQLVNTPPTLGVPDGLTPNAKGEVFFTDKPNQRIYKIGLDGKVSLFVENHPGCSGLMFGPDGRLYACQAGGIVYYDPDGKETVIAESPDCNDLVVSAGDEIYFTDHHNKVWFIDANRQKRVVDEGIAFPNGIRLSPDQSLLMVSDTRGQFVYSFHVEVDGSLTNKQKYFYLHQADGSEQSGADGMTVDTRGWLYVTTEIGLQICDPPGRVQAILSKPQRAGLRAVAFGGADMDQLYVACGDKVYTRKTKVKGALSFQDAFKPPAPHL